MYKLKTFTQESSHHIYWKLWAQLPHSYYFAKHILVLKFLNKGIVFEEIQDSHFPRKSGYFGTHLHEFGEKGVIFYVQCFTVKRGVHLGGKVSVLLRKRGRFELKSRVLPQKGVIFKLENKDGYHFSSEWGDFELVPNFQVDFQFLSYSINQTFREFYQCISISDNQ